MGGFRDACLEMIWRRVFPLGIDGSLVAPTVCVHWDPFHRLDVGMWRAIKAVALATLVFDVARQCDHLFGESEGILLFRGAADLLGLDRKNIKAPGGTRKIAPLPDSRRLLSGLRN